MFLHVSVILSTEGVPGQVPPWDQVHPGPGTPPWDQVHTSPRPGTPPGPGTPPPVAVHAGRYGQQAGGTHPTAMHSCFIYVNLRFIIQIIMHSFARLGIFCFGCHSLN